MTTDNSKEVVQKITDICFENGGVTKTMVDKLYQLTLQIRLEELEKHETQGLAWLYYYPKRKAKLTKQLNELEKGE